jgi:hypothetical protein
MVIPVEIMLRGRERVFTDRIVHEGGEPASWTAEDTARVLKAILRAIDRVLRPDQSEEAPVSLRGMSWIVSPYERGVVIALEIHTASAVAGPFDTSVEALERLIGDAMRMVAEPDQVH